MASAKNIGRVSGLAVALGIGAVLAANPAVATAETTDSDTQASDTDTATTSAAETDADSAGDTDTETVTETDRPLSRLIRNLTTPRAESESDDDDSENDAPRRFGIRWTSAANDSDDDIEELEESTDDEEPSATDHRPVFSETAVVQEVQRLFGVLTPETDTDTTDPEKPSTPAPALGLALTTLARRPDAAPVDEIDDDAEIAPAASITASAAEPHDPNPFRDEPIDPTVPELVRGVLEGVQGVLPDELDPIARESFEAVFRVSQMVPWVNFPVPALTIAALLQSALAGDKQATQTIVEQLILTVPVAGVAYYGWDQIADTLNYEDEGAALKRQAMDLAWDTIDFAHILHP